MGGVFNQITWGLYLIKLHGSCIQLTYLSMLIIAHLLHVDWLLHEHGMASALHEAGAAFGDLLCQDGRLLLGRNQPVRRARDHQHALLHTRQLRHYLHNTN